MRRFAHVSLALAPLALAPLALACSPAEPAPKTAAASATPAAPGSFEEQVQKGRTAFATFCAECHGDDLRGTNRAPSLLGKRSLGKTAKDTFDYLRGAMPPKNRDKVTEDDHWNVTAFLIDQHHWKVAGRLGADNAATTVKP